MNTEDMHNKNYYDILSSVAKTDEYDGILEYLPKFYKLLCNIITDDTASWYTRTLVNTALGHLVLEEDVIPDTLGPKGYLDDLFLMSYILKEIRDKVSTRIILNNMEGVGIDGDEVFDVIAKIYIRLRDHLGEMADDVLKFVGIEDFISLDLLCKSDTSGYTKNAKDKLQLLYAMAAVSIFDSSFLDLDELQEDSLIWEFIVNHPDFIEVKRYGSLLK